MVWHAASPFLRPLALTNYSNKLNIIITILLIQVVQFGGDASRAAQHIQRLEADLAKIDGLQKATAERATAAEERERSRSETIMELHNELTMLRDRWENAFDPMLTKSTSKLICAQQMLPTRKSGPIRYMQEVSELKVAHAGASEAASLRAQLVTAQDVSAGMVKAR